MEPRNQSKASWTTLPEEFAFKVLSALEKEFPVQVKLGEFIAEGKIYDSEILIRIGYLENGRIRQINFEASLDYDREKTDILENFYTCIDALGVWMHEYFEKTAKDEDANVDLPLVWRASDFKTHTVFFQFSTVNSRLEQEADRLLGVEAKLFNEDAIGEDAFDLAVVDPDLSEASAEAAEEHEHSEFLPRETDLNTH